MPLRQRLLSSPAFRDAKEALLRAIATETLSLREMRGPRSDTLRAQYARDLEDLTKMKGRDQYFTYLSNGVGSGPFIELTDGSVKLDLITGIGINFFGHSHPALMEELVDGITSDVMQGNLQPGFESAEILRTLLGLVGEKSNLKHAWLFGSGTMANETALKIIRQKKYPASKIFAFADCFAGRSTAMQEVTDNPKYREGQPVYGEVSHLPFYDPTLGVEASARKTVERMQQEIAKQPGKFAGIMLEIVQGEGGIRYAPREWYVAVLNAARTANLAIWFDEVQTFGRLESLFAFQAFGLDDYADVVTIGKLLHSCATLYRAEYNPKPGLVAGTFTGSNAALRTGRRILEILSQGGYYGPDGKIAKLSSHFRAGLERLKNGSCAGRIGEIRVIGGMIGFGVQSQNLDDTKNLLLKLFDAGVVAFLAGHDPYVVRCLPPFGVMEKADIDLALEKIEATLLSMSEPASAQGK